MELIVKIHNRKLFGWHKQPIFLPTPLQSGFVIPDIFIVILRGNQKSILNMPCDMIVVIRIPYQLHTSFSLTFCGEEKDLLICLRHFCLSGLGGNSSHRYAEIQWSLFVCDMPTLISRHFQVCNCPYSLRVGAKQLICFLVYGKPSNLCMKAVLDRGCITAKLYEFRSISNHRPLFNSLSRLRTKKTAKFRITVPLPRNPPVTGVVVKNAFFVTWRWRQWAEFYYVHEIVWPVERYRC